MINSKDIPGPEHDAEVAEVEVSPREFLDLTLQYLKTDYPKEIDRLKNITKKNPLFADTQGPHSFEAEMTLEIIQQMTLDRPIVIKSVQEALEGKLVKLVEMDAATFFYTGELLTPGPKKTIVERHFTKDQVPDIVSNLVVWIENRPTQDLSGVRYSAGNLGVQDLASEAQRLANTFKLIENQSKDVLAKKPIPLATQQGQRRLAIRAA